MSQVFLGIPAVEAVPLLQDPSQGVVLSELVQVLSQVPVHAEDPYSPVLSASLDLVATVHPAD